MYHFDFFMPSKVLFGEGRLQDLHKEKLPGSKALIVTTGGPVVKQFGHLSALENELVQAGVTYVLYDQIRPNPTRENVMEGATIAMENQCNFVIGLGGGSVMDCAKCIALMMTNPGDIWDYSGSASGGKKVPEHKAAPVVEVTTTAGSGSEVDMAAVITNEQMQEKSAFFFPEIFPTLSVVDSNLMKSVPPDFTAYQGMDAFFHAAESMLNKNEHPMGEMFALKAIELISKYLPRACRDGYDSEARAYVALGNSLAGYYMICTSMHTMEHVMGSFHEKLAHGAGLIMICHEYFDFFAQRQAAEEQMIKMARAMGVQNPTTGKDFIRALDDLVRAVGCENLRMSDAGIQAEELKKYPAKVHEVLGGDITADPLPLSDEDYLYIYEHSYR